MGGGISQNYQVLPAIYHQGDFSSSIHKHISHLFISKMIGKGASADVFHGRDIMAKKDIAIKKVMLSAPFLINKEEGVVHEINYESLFTELAAYKRVGCHSSVVTLHSAFHYHTSCYFVMDCLSGGDLRHYLRTNGTLNEKCVVYIVGCIGSALHHIHSRGVVHRDVKPENIGLDCRGRPYLMDFGISVVSSEDNPLPLCTTSSGTLQYLAPEVLAPGHRHAYQVDYWSLGVMSYELLFGIRPVKPRECVKFVSNEYGWLWDQILEKDEQSIFQLNFESFCRPENWSPPYPQCHLKLEQNGLPPKCLELLIPRFRFPSFHESTSDPISVSEEFHSLIHGLMDVRIPHRLGNMHRYTEFRDHQCFIRSVCGLSRISKYPSPLVSLPPMTPLSSVPLIPIISNAESSLSPPDHHDYVSHLSGFYYSNPEITHAGSLISQKTSQKPFLSPRFLFAIKDDCTKSVTGETVPL